MTSLPSDGQQIAWHMMEFTGTGEDDVEIRIVDIMLSQVRRRSGATNAMAPPGGDIIVTDALVALINPPLNPVQLVEKPSNSLLS